MKDKKTININEMHELKYWSNKFKVSYVELLKIIDEVGNKVENVKRYFKRKKTG